MTPPANRIGHTAHALVFVEGIHLCSWVLQPLERLCGQEKRLACAWGADNKHMPQVIFIWIKVHRRAVPSGDAQQTWPAEVSIRGRPNHRGCCWEEVRQVL